MTKYEVEHSFLLPFEATTDAHTVKQWFEQHSTKFIYFLPLYFFVVYGIQHYMKDRPRFQAKKAIFCWNILLSAFSVLAFIRLLPETIYTLRTFGYEYSICDSEFLRKNQVSSFWIHATAWSKVLELGDTVFLVLRKRKLTFLHVYHHALVYLITFVVFNYHLGAMRYIIVNLGIHGLMYGYYALRIIDVKLPKWAPMLLTSLQIIQMFFGIFLGTSAIYYGLKNPECRIYFGIWVTCIVTTISFAILFINYFRQTYVVSKKQN